MIKKIIFVALILCISFSLFAQTNLYWKLGYHTAVDFNTGTCVVNANDTCKIDMSDSNTGVCDNRGNIIFYSDGLFVQNKLDQTMPNGSNINHGTISDTYISQGWLPPYNIATVVPFPSDTNKFYMFYENLEYNFNGAYFPQKLRYLIVDKSLNGGLGDITQKEIDVISDTLYAGQIHAIKHGNGKDYWLIIRKYKSNIFYKVLINATGVNVVDTQAIGSAYPVSNTVGIYCGQSTVSLQGDKIAYLYQPATFTGNIPNGQMDIIDFDRCSGNIGNASNIIIPVTSTDTLVVIFSCFSPNGRFIYANDISKMYQFDTYNSNMVTNRIKLGNDTSWNFGQMQIAPDNKIYCAGYGSSLKMHVINSPDSLGLACNFVQDQIYLGGSPHYTDGGLPNVPNFSLGAINCNVGIEEIQTTTFDAFPNPANSRIFIKNSTFNSISIYNLLGELEQEQKVKQNATNEIDISKLSKGLYFLKAVNEKGEVLTKKMVKE